MCTAIALAVSELPVDLVRRDRIAERKYVRERQEEFQFHWWQTPTILPVRRDGVLEMLAWGSKRRRGPLPYGGWIAEEHVKDGLLAGANPEEVVIPANLGYQKGTWFLIIEGIRGVAIETAAGRIVYMLTEPASNYYRNMTEQSPTMPLLVNQVI
jgi:hypothetical protein